MVSGFKIRRSWLSPPRGDTAPELDATLCKLEITLQDRNVTTYAEDHVREDHLEVPSYYLAEWMAENWWALLHEPRKSDDQGEQADYAARHSFLTAQHGFPLPEISVVPLGKDIYVSATARTVQYADIRFVYSGSSLVERKHVVSELTRFVDGTVDRLKDRSITNTPLEEAWALVRDTQEDETQFCALIGSLGLSPYNTHEAIEGAVERVLESFGDRVARDLCFAATAENVIEAAAAAQRANEAMSNAQVISLEPLATVPLPEDNPTLPGYRRGKNAALSLRRKFNISLTDPGGGEAVFDKLKLDASRRVEGASNANLPLVGAVSRDEATAKLALMQAEKPSRRFTAARGAYLAWTAAGNTRRLITNAVTREQQASRAFAAELLAPFDYIRTRAKNNKLEQQRVYEIAEGLQVSPEVVFWQAQNNGLQIAPV